MRSSFVIAIVALFVLAGMAAAIDLGSCADGTKYGKCSTQNPGSYCTGSPPALMTYTALCKCTDVFGWTQQGTGDDATCVQAKCDDGTLNGNCATTKPKVCVGGSVYSDNATKCGCPTGKKVSVNGVFCEWIPCNDSGSVVDEGLCSPKRGKKCVNGQLVDKASECGCPTGQTKTGETCSIICDDGTKDGSCSATLPKECTNGYLLDNAAKCGCPQGMKAVGKQCSSSVLDIGGADLLGGSQAQNTTGATGTTNALSCCCLPTALIGLIGGYVFVRKKE